MLKSELKINHFIILFQIQNKNYLTYSSKEVNKQKAKYYRLNFFFIEQCILTVITKIPLIANLYGNIMLEIL